MPEPTHYLLLEGTRAALSGCALVYFFYAAQNIPLMRLGGAGGLAKWRLGFAGSASLFCVLELLLTYTYGAWQAAPLSMLLYATGSASMLCYVVAMGAYVGGGERLRRAVIGISAVVFVLALLSAARAALYDAPAPLRAVPFQGGNSILYALSGGMATEPAPMVIALFLLAWAGQLGLLAAMWLGLLEGKHRDPFIILGVTLTSVTLSVELGLLLFAPANMLLLAFMGNLPEVMRTTVLAQRDAVLQRDALEARSEIQAQFLATISHEIRAPLGAVIGGIEVLQRRERPPEEMEVVRALKASAVALMAIVSDVLDHTRLEVGQLPLERRPVHPESLVRGALDVFRHDAAAKGVALKARVGEGVGPAFLGDPARLRQILINLVGNALKFTDAGQIEVGVQAIDGPALRFSVTDTGVGIAAAEAARLFEPFEQGAQSRAREVGGSGLGLSISRALVHRMGGQIGARPRAAGGAEFWFEVPAAPAPQAPTRAPPARTPHPLSERGLTGLIVDDQPINRQIVGAMLEALGIQVEAVSSGQEALDTLQQRPFDFVILDKRMPGMDGVETTRRLRALPGPASATPIIGLSADATEQERARCLDAGMETYLCKPVTMAQLNDALQRVLPLPQDVAPAGASGPAEDARACDACPHRGGPCLRLEALTELLRLEETGSASGLVRELVDKLSETEGDLLPDIERALEARDFAAARDNAHALKGLAGALGAAGLMEAAQALEDSAEAERSAHAEVQRLWQAHACAVRQLRAYLP